MLPIYKSYFFFPNTAMYFCFYFVFTLQGCHIQVSFFLSFASKWCLIKWNVITFIDLLILLDHSVCCTCQGVVHRKLPQRRQLFSFTSLGEINCRNWGQVIAFVLPQMFVRFDLFDVSCMKLLVGYFFFFFFCNDRHLWDTL